jgi:hypothetical protein
MPHPIDNFVAGRDRALQRGKTRVGSEGLLMHTVVSLPSPDELRRYVRETLCDHDRLALDAVTFLEGFVKRAGRICGVYFEVQGPRQMRSHAIWVGHEHRILFYDSLGTRFLDVSLSEGPDPEIWISDLAGKPDAGALA